jgi:hypothetical protein
MEILIYIKNCWLRGAKIKNLKLFFCIFGFHGLPPVNLSNTYFRGLGGKVTISYGIIDFFVSASIQKASKKYVNEMMRAFRFRNAKKNNYQVT